MKNMDLHVLIYDKKIRKKDIARKMNISHFYLSRILASEMSAKRRLQIIRAIDELCKERGDYIDVDDSRGNATN